MRELSSCNPWPAALVAFASSFATPAAALNIELHFGAGDFFGLSLSALSASASTITPEEFGGALDDARDDAALQARSQLRRGGLEFFTLSGSFGVNTLEVVTGPLLGVINFDNEASTTWSFHHTVAKAAKTADLDSVAAPEMLHGLGFSGSDGRLSTRERQRLDRGRAHHPARQRRGSDQRRRGSHGRRDPRSHTRWRHPGGTVQKAPSRSRWLAVMAGFAQVSPSHLPWGRRSCSRAAVPPQTR